MRWLAGHRFSFEQQATFLSAKKEFVFDRNSDFFVFAVEKQATRWRAAAGNEHENVVIVVLVVVVVVMIVLLICAILSVAFLQGAEKKRVVF